MLDLVTDRTPEDVTRLQRILSTKKELRTPEEQAELDSHTSKGAYNYTDLNRVTAAVEYLVAEIEKRGYCVAGYTPVEVSSGRYRWIENEKPTPEQLEQYRQNVESVRNALTALSSIPEVPSSMRFISEQQANDIESILLYVERVLNFISAYDYSRVLGTFYCGGNYTTQLFSRGR